MPISFLLCCNTDGDSVRAFAVPAGQNPEAIKRLIERAAEGIGLNVDVCETPAWLPTPENITAFLRQCWDEKEKASRDALAKRGLFPPLGPYEKN